MARALSPSTIQALRGHYWTIGPWARFQLAPRRAPEAQPWSTVLEDPSVGPVRIGGWLRHGDPARGLVVVVHGLGGMSESHYVIDAAIAAERAGLGCLRLDLRGADDRGEDFYHAGLTADLEAALAHPELARYERMYVLGYSLGGHLTLRYALGAVDPRVQAVAAICAPIDLDRACSFIDRPERWPYRRHILVSLKRMLEAVGRRRRLHVSLDELRSIQTLRSWDTRVVAPRFGFASAEAYYASTSVAPLLGALAVPALLVATEADPMVLADAVRPALPREAPRLHVRWLADGGHVGFPPRVDLGAPGPLGVEAQVIGWLRSA